MLAARREDRLSKLAEDLKAEGAEVTWQVTDVTDRNQVESLAASAKETFGRIDVLINNAGLMPLAPLDALKVDEIRSTNISPGAIDTELTSTITDPNAKQAADELYKVAIDSDAVARAIVYAIEQPADVDINEIILRPTAQEL